MLLRSGRAAQSCRFWPGRRERCGVMVTARGAVPHRQVFTERARGRRLGSGTCGVARASLEGHLL